MKKYLPSLAGNLIGLVLVFYKSSSWDKFGHFLEAVLRPLMSQPLPREVGRAIKANAAVSDKNTQTMLTTFVHSPAWYLILCTPFSPQKNEKNVSKECTAHQNKTSKV